MNNLIKVLKVCICIRLVTHMIIHWRYQFWDFFLDTTNNDDFTVNHLGIVL